MLPDPSRPIVIIAFNAFRPGGSQTYALELARLFETAHADVHLIAKKGAWTAKAAGVATTTEVRWREGEAHGSVSMLKRLAFRFFEQRTARKISPVLKSASLLITFQPWPAAFFRRYAVGRWEGTPHYALVHGTTPVEWPLAHAETVLPALDGLLAATPEVEQRIRTDAPHVPLALVGNLFSATRYWEGNIPAIQASYDSTGPIVFVGTLTPNKTAPVHSTINSLRAVNRSLIVVGDGPDRESLEARVSEAGVEDLVKFIGEIADPRPFISSASVVISGGRGALEALSVARPVVVATSDGIHGTARLQDLMELEACNFTGRTKSSRVCDAEIMEKALSEALLLESAERLEIATKTASIGNPNLLVSLLTEIND